VRVLVTGANGFIGTHVVAALHEAGHDIVRAVRRPSASDLEQRSAVTCDFSRDTDARVWEQRLERIDAVVNCAGILRETGVDKFQSTHVDAPLALFRACVSTGIHRVIQISALGESQDGEFVASKHRCDDGLAKLDFDWLVLRPGLVYSAHAAYGGTSMLRAMSALPIVQFLPGDGEQELRPVAAQDLADAVVAALASPHKCREVVELVGPETLTLRAYLLAWRTWFGLNKPVIVPTPMVLVNLVVALGELSGRGPLCKVIANLMQNQRVGGKDAHERTRALLGREPICLGDALRQRPSTSQDLLAARWYWLQYVLLLSLAIVWIASGLVGFSLPPSIAEATMPGWPPQLVRVLTLAGSSIDLLLGLALLTGRAPRLVLLAMLLMIAGYTLVIGVAAPQQWLDPIGGLLKNLPIAAIIIASLALGSRPR
jgi:uncharacterized protein YbjT (DUF2867 family)/uncharacterized membrane protein YphA (DoxX/SURF4 family)